MTKTNPFLAAVVEKLMGVITGPDGQPKTMAHTVARLQQKHQTTLHNLRTALNEAGLQENLDTLANHVLLNQGTEADVLEALNDVRKEGLEILVKGVVKPFLLEKARFPSLLGDRAVDALCDKLLPRLPDQDDIGAEALTQRRLLILAIDKALVWFGKEPMAPHLADNEISPMELAKAIGHAATALGYGTQQKKETSTWAERAAAPASEVQIGG